MQINSDDKGLNIEIHNKNFINDLFSHINKLKLIKTEKSEYAMLDRVNYKTYLEVCAFDNDQSYAFMFSNKYLITLNLEYDESASKYYYIKNSGVNIFDNNSKITRYIFDLIEKYGVN